MLTPPTDAELFTHVRMITSMVLGLSVARLISGLMRFLQHPGREPVSPPHLLWAAFVLLSIIHFWWFEIALAHTVRWSFATYLSPLAYAGSFVALASILFPDNTNEYNGLADYFRQRRHAFYLLLLLFLGLDVVDTVIKGHDYYMLRYGWYYPLRQSLLAAGILLALLWRNERYQAAFPALALALQVVWIAGLSARPA